MTSIYLSPAMPRWVPKTEADLQSALASGIADESHYLDFKETLAGKADNKELARDLASFAVDGGTLIIGVAEDKDNRIFSLAPQSLKGLPERVEDATRALTDPALPVITTVIESAADPLIGYLLVHVPASPAAPHMVDGRFMGRGDKTKHTMSAPEVLRLHQRRRVAEADALDLLADEIARDPMKDEQDQAHLFLLAQPQTGRPDMLLELTNATNWNERLSSLIEPAYSPELNGILKEIHPNLLRSVDGYRRARGIAKATHHLGEGRIFERVSGSRSNRAIELQAFEDGGLRLFFTRLSDYFERADSTVDEIEQSIWDAAATSLTRRFLAIVIATAEETGYTGNWSLAIGATGLRGQRAAYDPAEHATSARYDREDYRQATEATWAELNNQPGAISRRLVGPLLRSLAVEHRFDQVFKD